MFTVHVVNKNFNVFRSFKQDKNVINIPFIKRLFKMLGTVVQPFNFMMT